MKIKNNNTIIFADIGNTFVDYIVYDGDIKYNKIHTKNFKHLYKKYFNAQFFISCVVNKIEKRYSKNKNIRFLSFKNITKYIKINYDIKNLGSDRILGIFAAKNFFKKNVVIISCGTCLTLDYLNKNGVYSGGEIFPGINLSLITLKNNASKLPLVKYKKLNIICGQDTESCILSGINNFYKQGILNFINYLNPNVVLISGGDRKKISSLIEKEKMKNKIFLVKNIVICGIIVFCFKKNIISYQEFKKILKVCFIQNNFQTN